MAAASKPRKSAAKSGQATGQATGTVASRLIDQRIRELAGWRGETLARMRALIHAADPGAPLQYGAAKKRQARPPVMGSRGSKQPRRVRILYKMRRR